MNRNFFKILRNLKYDQSESVREFLYDIDVALEECVSEAPSDFSPSKVQVVDLTTSEDIEFSSKNGESKFGLLSVPDGEVDDDLKRINST